MRRIGDILRHRVRSLFARGAVESELDEELQYHLEREIEEQIASGLSPEEARRRALRELGAITQNKEVCRDMRGLNWFDHIRQDFRYAIRQLGKAPSFACAAAFVLALGIAAAVAIFGIVQAALLQPLPYRDPSRLVAAFAAVPGNSRISASYLNFVEWKRLNQVLDSIDGYALNGGFTLSSASGAEPVTGTRVSADFFRTLGVRPVLGRDFRPEEGSLTAQPAVMISYEAWQGRFSGRADVLGSSVILNGIPRTIIGVLPREFHFAPVGRGEFWGTLRSDDPCEQNRGCQNLQLIARLAQGSSIEAAAAGSEAILRGLQRQYPGENRHIGSAAILPLRDFVVGDVRPVLLVLLAGAGVLLLIAWVNGITLLLARSEGRRAEIAVRGSLGATAGRLLSQFAVEGIVLAAAGGALGIALAGWGMRLLIQLIPAQRLYNMPYLRDLGWGIETIAAVALLTAISAVLFAVVPVARLPLTQTGDSVRDGSRRGTGLMWRRFGRSLVVVEVALAMVLMTSAAVLGKSLYTLLHVDIGLQPDGLASVETKWPPARYASNDEKVALGRKVVEKIAAIPGVSSVAISLAAPLGTPWGNTSFHIAGQPNRGEYRQVLHRQVSAGYFATLQAQLIRGRYFRDSDSASHPKVAIVNRSVVARYFGSVEPVGKQIYYNGAPEAPMEIVGVVEDVKEGRLEEANLPVLYVPYDQNPKPWFAVLVRTAPGVRSALASIPPAIHEIDPDIAVTPPAEMRDRMANSSVAYVHRSSAWLVGGFAFVAFVLGVVGLYGVVSYSVGQRTREIGVRMALGADAGAVRRLILGEASRLVGAGAFLGVVGSLAAARLMRGLFFGVRAWDVTTLAIIAATLVSAALLASFVPARRAAATNPIEALRSE